MLHTPREEDMARVLGVHEIELVPGTDPEEFERAAAAVLAAGSPDGWRTRFLKGERGPRTDHYLMLLEIDSLEERNRYYPAEGQVAEDVMNEYDRDHPDEAAAWDRLFPMIVDMSAATDYVDLTD